MVKYLPIGDVQTASVSVNRNPITMMVEFNPPDGAREKMTYEEVCRITGRRACTFYVEPQKGDILSIAGHLWGVQCRIIFPNYYRSPGRRTIPTIVVKYLGSDDSLDMFLSEMEDPHVPT